MAVSLSPRAQLRLGPIQSHSNTSCHSNHTLSSVSKSQKWLFPVTPGALTELKTQTEKRPDRKQTELEL